MARTAVKYDWSSRRVVATQVKKEDYKKHNRNHHTTVSVTTKTITGFRNQNQNQNQNQSQLYWPSMFTQTRNLTPVEITLNVH